MMADHDPDFHDGRSDTIHHSSGSWTGYRDRKYTRERNDDRNCRKWGQDTEAGISSRSPDRRRSRSRSPYADGGHMKRKSSLDSRSPVPRGDEYRQFEGHRSRRHNPSASPPHERHRRSSAQYDRSNGHRRQSSSPNTKRSQHDSRIPDNRMTRRRGESFSPSPKRRRKSSQDDSKRPSRHRYASSLPRRSPSPPIRSKAPLPSQEQAYNKDPTSTTITKPPEPEKQKPNYAPTGKLAAETNTVVGTSIVLKYNEPPEARLPASSAPWRLFVFKGKDLLESIPLSTRSCWLFGRERAVVDFPTEHPSCSKQHAVLQFRYVEKKNEYGDKIGGVKPYMVDLESANGTKLNGEKMEARRYVEVMSGDVVTFGDSTREYVVMLPPKD